jgi:hypothetical protein
VEYVDHLISSTGTSFTSEKRLQVLDFPLPETEKALLQFIGLVNYFRDQVPRMTEMVQPLRKLIDIKKYKGSKKLTWTEESIGGYMYMVTNGQVRFFSKSLIGSQLNWSTREKDCSGIFEDCVKLFEDLLDNRYFILKTDNGSYTCRITTSIYSMSLAEKNTMPCHDYVRIIYFHHLLWLTNAQSSFDLS